MIINELSFRPCTMIFHSYPTYLFPAQALYRYYKSTCRTGTSDATCTPELIGPMAFARSTHVLHSIVMTLTYIERLWLSFACPLCIRTAAVDLLLLSNLWNCTVLPHDHPRSCVIRLSYRQYKKKYQRSCSPGT